MLQAEAPSSMCSRDRDLEQGRTRCFSWGDCASGVAARPIQPVLDAAACSLPCRHAQPTLLRRHLVQRQRCHLLARRRHGRTQDRAGAFWPCRRKGGKLALSGLLFETYPAPSPSFFFFFFFFPSLVLSPVPALPARGAVFRGLGSLP